MFNAQVLSIGQKKYRRGLSTGQFQHGAVQTAEQLQSTELVLKGQLHSLDIAISQLVNFKPYLVGQSADPNGMLWVTNELYAKKSIIEAKCRAVRKKILLQNLCSNSYQQ